MRGISSWKRAVGWALVAVTCTTAAALHRHVSFSDFVDEDYASNGRQRAVTSHNPLSSATHWHRVVRFEEDNCPACHSQRAAGLVAGMSAAPDAPHVFFALAVSVDPVLARPAVTDGSRAPPFLL